MSLSRSKRAKGGVAFRLTDRDGDILKAVNRYRYMRTGQINRLLFQGNTSTQSCQKRLKLLFHNGYLDRIEPFLQQGSTEQSAGVAYRLDAKAVQYLTDFDIPIPYLTRKRRVKHQFLLHALDLSEFRLHLELAIEDTEALLLRRFVPDFMQKEGAASLTGYRRYRLYDKIRDPVTGETVIFYPDAAFILQSATSEAARLFFLEVDRGTEGLETIRRKLAAFHVYAAQGLFKKFGPYERFVVLFQTSTPKRAENMVRLVRETVCQPTVLITDHRQVTADSVLHQPIWRDKSGEPKSLVQPRKLAISAGA